MKVHVKLVRVKYTSLILACFIWVNVTNAQNQFKVFQKSPVPIVVNNLGEEYNTNPFGGSSLDYHKFKDEGEDPWSTTQGDWYLKYKAMFDFRCKEQFWGASPAFKKNDYMTSGYKFRLVNSQIIEDSISFLISKYYYNSVDTLKKWNLPSGNDRKSTEKIIRRLGLEHFKMIECVFDSKKYSKFIEVPEAEQANDNMVYMEVFKYPADIDIFLYNFKIENWEYVESVTVSGDHELELYVLQKFEPRYLKDCKK
jgi:hypothetical protein